MARLHPQSVTGSAHGGSEGASPVDDTATSDFYARIEYPGPQSLVTTVWANRLKPHVGGAPFTFLDAGCGAGRHLAGMLKTYPLARGVGIDISAPSLDQARMLLDRLDLSERAQLHLASFSEKLAFPATFDVVVSAGTIHHSPDPAASFRNLARVLKSGGLFAGMVYGERGHRRRYEIKEALALVSGGQPAQIYDFYLQYAAKYETWRDLTFRQLTRSLRRRLGRWRSRLFGERSAWGYDPGQKSRVFVLDAYAAPIDMAFDTRQLRTMLDDAGLDLVEMLNLGRRDKTLLPEGWAEKVNQLPEWDQLRVYELLDPMPESLTFIARKR